MKQRIDGQEKLKIIQDWMSVDFLINLTVVAFILRNHTGGDFLISALTSVTAFVVFLTYREHDPRQDKSFVGLVVSTFVTSLALLMATRVDVCFTSEIAWVFDLYVLNTVKSLLSQITVMLLIAVEIVAFEK